MQCQKLKTYMETGRVMFLPARAIRPNPAQPRTVFREEALAELADSIRQHGILQPLSVRRVGSAYELIAGERMPEKEHIMENSESLYELFKNMSVGELEAQLASTDDREEKIFLRALVNLKLQLVQEKIVGEMLL